MLVAGALRNRCPPPFGPAANGAIYYSVNGDIVAIETPERRTHGRDLGGPTSDSGPWFSPDGDATSPSCAASMTGEPTLWVGSRMRTARRAQAGRPFPTIGLGRVVAPGRRRRRDDSTRTRRSIRMVRDGRERIERHRDRAQVGREPGLPAVPTARQHRVPRVKPPTATWGIYLIGRDGTNLQRLDAGSRLRRTTPTTRRTAITTSTRRPGRRTAARCCITPSSRTRPRRRARASASTSRTSIPPAPSTSERKLEFDREADDEFDATFLPDGRRDRVPDDRGRECTSCSQADLSAGAVGARPGHRRHRHTSCHQVSPDGRQLLPLGPDGERG